MLIQLKSCCCVPQHNNNKKEVINLNLKEKIIKWCLQSNIHGVSNLIKSKYLHIKVIYILALLISTIFCTVFIVWNYLVFTSYHVSSRYSIIQGPDETFYPVFTICSTSKSFDKTAFFQKECFGEIGKTKKFNEDEMDYKNYYNTTFCYSMNLNKSNLAYIDNDGISHKCLFSIKPSILNTAYIAIHNQDRMPEHGDFFEVSIGEEISIGLSRISRKTLEIPYGTCASDWDSVNKPIGDFYKKYYRRNIFNQSYQYNSKACKDYCYYQKMVSACKDSLPENIFELNFLNNCSLQPNLNYDINIECEKECPEVCILESYDFNWQVNLNKNDLTNIYVYFDDNYISEINDIPTLQWPELLASIGLV